MTNPINASTVTPNIIETTKDRGERDQLFVKQEGVLFKGIPIHVWRNKKIFFFKTATRFSTTFDLNFTTSSVQNVRIDKNSSIMSDAGFFVLELSKIDLAFTKPSLTEADFLRIDCEIVNGPIDLKWVTSGTTTLQTDKIKPFVQESPPANEGEEPSTSTKYILGFTEPGGIVALVRRSTYITLSSEAITKLANATLTVKCMVVREPPAVAVEVKKGTPPVAAVATEEVLVEVSLPLASLMRVKGAVVEAPNMALDNTTSDPQWQVNTVINTAGGAAALSAKDSTISWRVSAGNHL